MQITVIIPTYNRYTLLRRALESVYAQTHMPHEVIIIDDGSTDATAQIQTDFPHVKYIYQENKGVSSARNLGIRNSTCKWIAFLDADDTWHVDKLALQVHFHKQNPHVTMSYTDEKWIRNGIAVTIPKKFKKHGGSIFNECLSHCIIAPSATLLHKDLFDEVGVFDEALEVCEDYDLWLRIACENTIGLVDEKLITKYAGHEDQLSFKHWGMDRFRVIALEKFLDTSKRSIVTEILLKKYKLLLKGAIKYNRVAERETYTKKINYLSSISSIV
ncbi:glycosyltransferase family 2 protein [Sulfurimonas sp. SAG-AH-194-I05]|nr:glycosyltransferase family A protein [Sulfurimonas sp. SAG-AH-194-I05]MDF1875400.1 glycosyltransferase family 2 protein [Sulfurimonas sp. SAG-AH-194-I05]